MKLKQTMLALASPFLMNAQEVMSPETLWTLRRISVQGVSPDQSAVLYKTSQTNLETEKNTHQSYLLNAVTSQSIPFDIGEKSVLQWDKNGLYALENGNILLSKDQGKTWTTFYHIGKEAENIRISPDGSKIAFSRAVQLQKVYGREKYADLPKTTAQVYTDLNHRHWDTWADGKYNHIFVVRTNESVEKAKDLLEGKPFDSPQKPFGGKEDFIFSPDSKHLLFVTKQHSGKEYAQSIFFTAAYRGTKQLFSVNTSKAVKQITKGNFDVNNIFAQNKNTLLVTRNDAFHSPELYSVELKSGKMKQATDVNKDFYQKLSLGHSELKMVKTSDGKEMGVWFHYPPNFDPNKKYPTLLYCQGGPQSALTPYFSLRWNFSLMTANGYIVVAPNRRGMPGWGTKWNEQISQDWGGQPIQDYLSAADFAKTLPYVDGNRMGAVGASYGGYSVLMLAGVHQNRFKTFISHNGLFDMKSWYGTTEELWFANWDLGSSPWENPNSAAYTKFSPSNYIKKWNTPIMIIQGGLDFRVPYEQGQQAFQSARLRNLKAKFLYFPDENHWVLKPQNALVWQREFFEWLKETL